MEGDRVGNVQRHLAELRLNPSFIIVSKENTETFIANGEATSSGSIVHFAVRL